MVTPFDEWIERKGLMPQPTHSEAVRTAWWRSPERLGVIAVLTGLITVLAFRLGPAVVGVKSFSAMDRLASVAPWWDGGVSGPVLNPFLGDSIDSLLPSYIQIHERLTRGDWALWSNLGGPGTELLSSTNTPTLTLSTIWFLILPTVYAPVIAKLAEIALATAGMYLWMRRIGLGRPAGLLAGVFYCGSGFFVGWATWSAQSSVAAMMPALFWAVEFLIERRTFRAALPITAVVALLLLGGFPAAAGHTLYAGGLYFIVRLVAERAGHSVAAVWRVFFAGVCAVLLGVAVSALQTVPLAFGLADTDLSVRSDQFYAQQPVGSLLSMFFPGSMYMVGYGAGTNPIEAYAFLGIGAVAFAMAAVLTRRPHGQSRAVVPFLAAGMVLAAAVVWKQGWWTAWLAHLPVFSGNNSGRLRDIVCLFGAALAGIGAERVFRAAPPARKRLIIILATSGAVFGALTVLMWLRHDQVPTSTLALDALPGLLIILIAGLSVLLHNRRRVVTTAFVLVAMLAGLQMSTSVSNYWPLSDTEAFYPRTALIDAASAEAENGRILASGGFMGSTASAYGIRSATAHSFQPKAWREFLEALQLGAFQEGQSPTNPTLTFPEEETPAQARLLNRLSASAWVSALSQMVPGERVDRGGQPASAVEDAPSTMTLEAGETIEVPVSMDGIRGLALTVTAPVAPAEGVTITAELTDTADAMVASGAITRRQLQPGEVTLAIAGENLKGDAVLRLSSSADVKLTANASDTPVITIIRPTDDGLRLAFADSHGAVWVRENALPRVRWQTHSEVVGEATARLQRLQDADLPENTVVLSEPGPVAEGRAAVVSVVEDAGDVLRVDIDADGRGYLVVADWMHRGWRASIDGEDVEIVEADHALSAVSVPAGKHRVTFTYGGEGAALGASMSGFALLVIVAILGLQWARNRRRRATDATESASSGSRRSAVRRRGPGGS